MSVWIRLQQIFCLQYLAVSPWTLPMPRAWARSLALRESKTDTKSPWPFGETRVPERDDFGAPAMRIAHPRDLGELDAAFGVSFWNDCVAWRHVATFSDL